MVVEAISSYISEHGLKRKFISQQIGMSSPALSDALNGKRKLSVDEYEKLCDVLAVPYEYFFNNNNKTAQEAARDDVANGEEAS